MKFLEEYVRAHGMDAPLAYFHPNWRRDAAPLLDELGASVDHVEAHSKGGTSTIENHTFGHTRLDQRGNRKE
jgi:hypothetical protein